MATVSRLGGFRTPLPSMGGGVFMSNALITPGGSALEQLKKTADRMLENQTKAKQIAEAERAKLCNAAMESRTLQAELKKERQISAELRAKVEDDTRQMMILKEKMVCFNDMQKLLQEWLQKAQEQRCSVEIHQEQASAAVQAKLKMIERLELAHDELLKQREALQQRLMEAGQLRVEGEAALGGALATIERKDVDIANLNKRLVELDDELKCANDQLASCKQDISDLQQQLAEHRRQIQELEQQCQQLTDDLSRAHEAEAQLQVKVAEMGQIQEELSEQLSQAREQRAHDVAAIERLQGCLDAMQADCTTAQEEISSLQGDVRCLQEDNAATASELENVRKKLQDEQAKLEQALLAAKEAQLQGEKQRADAIADGKAKVNEERAAWEQKLMNFSDRMAKEMNDIKTKSKADADAAIEKIAIDLQHERSAKNEMELQLSDSVKQTADLAQHCAAQQEQLQLCEGRIQELQGVVDAKGAELEQLQLNSDSKLLDNNTKHSEELASVEASLRAKHSEELEQLQASLNSVAEELQQAKRAVAEQQQSFTQQLSAKDIEIHNLKLEAEMAKSRHQAVTGNLGSEIEDYKAEVAQLNEELHSQREEQEELQQRLEAVEAQRNKLASKLSAIATNLSDTSGDSPNDIVKVTKTRRRAVERYTSAPSAQVPEEMMQTRSRPAVLNASQELGVNAGAVEWPNDVTKHECAPPTQTFDEAELFGTIKEPCYKKPKLAPLPPPPQKAAAAPPQQNRRSRFTGMSMQSVSIDVAHEITSQRRPAVKKPARAGGQRQHEDFYGSAVMDVFGSALINPYAFQISE